MDLNTAQLLGLEYTLAAMGLLLCTKCLFLKKDNMVYFARCVFVLTLGLLVNVPIRYVELYLVHWNREVVYALYSASIILMTFMAYYWFVFTMKQINSRTVKTSLRVHLYSIPAFFSIILCICNKQTGWLFYIDEASCYHRGSLFLQAIFTYGYIIMLAISNVVHLIREKDKTAPIKCFVALIPVFMGITIQVLFGGSYLMAGILFCCTIMYVEICLDRQKAYEVSDAIAQVNKELIHSNKEVQYNMRTILALSDIYHIMYDADFENNTFKEIKATPEVSAFCSKFTTATELLKNLAENLYIPSDVEQMKVLYNLEYIQEKLKNTNSFFADGRGIFTKLWLRTNVIVTERDAQGKAIRFVFAIQNVDELIKSQQKIEESKQHEAQAKAMKELFIQTAKALSGSIDAKDRYTHGHSVRVADYSKKLAVLCGIPEKECEEIYFAALLHDVGKIGIRDSIITKDGKLTQEEYDVIKKHPKIGGEILNKISLLPYLSLGAMYHHERYDGKGYPKKLKGDDIPLIARIISVADAYDAMTSTRSYRGIIPQIQVREQLALNAGTQFDPVIANHMIHLIDEDLEYKMREFVESAAEQDKEYDFGNYLESVSDPILFSSNPKTVNLSFRPKESVTDGTSFFNLMLYDSLDAKIYTDKESQEKIHFINYATINPDGTVIRGDIRNIQITEKNGTEITPQQFIQVYEKGMKIQLEFARVKDHLRIRMKNGLQEFEYIIAIMDGVHFAYCAVAGQNCNVIVSPIKEEKQPLQENDIPRIAPEVSFAVGPEGDIPNLQVDAWRCVYTKPVPVKSDMEITFHTMSLPTARLIWHCPFMVLYSSDNNEIKGPDYKEYAQLRSDGEVSGYQWKVENKFYVNRTLDFESWESWKERNKAGTECNVSITRKDNTVITRMINEGIELTNVTTFPEQIPENLCVAFTGDQVAFTNIRIKSK